MSDVPCVDIHNGIARHDSHYRTEHAYLVFQQPCSARSIKPWPNHVRHSSLIRSCPPTVARVRDLVINHQLAGPQRNPKNSRIRGRILWSCRVWTVHPGISLYVSESKVCTAENIISVKENVMVNEIADSTTFPVIARILRLLTGMQFNLCKN